MQGIPHPVPAWKEVNVIQEGMAQGGEAPRGGVKAEDQLELGVVGGDSGRSTVVLVPGRRAEGLDILESSDEEDDVIEAPEKDEGGRRMELDGVEVKLRENDSRHESLGGVVGMARTDVLGDQGVSGRGR